MFYSQQRDLDENQRAENMWFEAAVRTHWAPTGATAVGDVTLGNLSQQIVFCFVLFCFVLLVEALTHKLLPHADDLQ